MENSGRIKINDLSVGFNGRVLFEGLNVDIESGQRVLITGASGSGKSTLLRCLLGFTAPLAGRVWFDEDELEAQSVWQLRRRMAYVPQEPIFGQPTVVEALKMPFSYRSNSHLQWQESKVDELFEHFGLASSMRTAKTEELSGGEKQRIAIISAILLERGYMFLDEPTSALDIKSKVAFVEAVQEIKDTTIVIVSHDEKNFNLADKVVDITPVVSKEVSNG